MVLYINNVHIEKMNETVGKPEKITEQEILDQAVVAIEQETGLRLNVVARKVQNQLDRKVIYEDAILRIDDEEYVAVIKRWAQHATLGAVVDMIKRYPNGILVADYVNPKMADRLRQRDVQFIDTAGNAFVKTPFHHVLIKGNRKPETLGGGGIPRKRRAFTATGLKVTYAFLCQPELVAEPYRGIAEIAGVALGTVGRVIDDLVEAGHLVERNGERRLVHREALLQTWVERYPAALRPKLQLGVFNTEQANWWTNFPIQEFGGYWGGEIAGAHYTDYLRPAIATIYLPKLKQRELIAAARLRKMALPIYQPGIVELLTPFWAIHGDEDPYVHPILAYADLIATGDARNLEVAEKLYDDRLVRHLQ